MGLHPGRGSPALRVSSDLQTRQCAVNVTARDLALMSTTLPNGGCQPHSGEQLIQPLICRHVLAVMITTESVCLQASAARLRADAPRLAAGSWRPFQACSELMQEEGDQHRIQQVDEEG